MDSSTLENSEEEISLIDLLAVVIRYRKLIVLGTAIITVLAGLYLFIVPKIMPSTNKTTLKVSYTVLLNDLPENVRVNLKMSGLSIGTLFSTTMNTPSFLAEEYKKYPLSTAAGNLEGYRYNAFIDGMLTKKIIETKVGRVSNTYEVKLTVGEEGLENANLLVGDMVTNCDERVKLLLLPKIEELLENTQTAIADFKSEFASATDASTLQELQSLAQSLRSYLKTFDGFFLLQPDSFIMQDPQGRGKKLIITFFAAFFVFVFIAFACNAVANIKKDPEASKTIADAWQAGK